MIQPGSPATLDHETSSLVRLSARIAAGPPDAVRAALAACVAADTPEMWVEELILQSYLVAGLPRALNAAREWRKLTGAGGGAGALVREGESYASVFDWRSRGEATCAAVYGSSYEKLRANVAALHPALDQWMVVEGYGKVLSRTGLDLGRRELCNVAACAATAQERQLHSHLLGARNVGVPEGVIDEALGVLAGTITDDELETARLLWHRIRGR